MSNFGLDLQVLAKALTQPLPGVEAQLNLAHPARKLSPPADVSPREAGVLILLYPGQNGDEFPLIVRTSHNPRDRHRGQISLPGGKREVSDKSLIDTALREGEEEVGIRAKQVEILGQLSPLYIPVSNFLVQPVLGFVKHKPHWIPQQSEVSRIIEAPLQRLHADDVVKHIDMPVSEQVKLRRVPYFDLAGEVVWGATAMILSELRQIVRGLPTD